MFRLKRPSPALVVSIIALVAAIAVPAFALTNSEKKVVKRLANGEITKRAPGLSVASAKTANSAGNANALDGMDSEDFAGAGSEPWQAATLNDGSFDGVVAPHFGCFWENYGDGHSNAAFLRDPAGFVHLKGVVDANDGDTHACSFGPSIFTLPPGYRPNERAVFLTVSNNKAGRININQTTGAVEIESGFPAFVDAEEWVTLDGISFRCAPSGQNGCP